MSISEINQPIKRLPEKAREYSKLLINLGKKSKKVKFKNKQIYNSHKNTKIYKREIVEKLLIGRSKKRWDALILKKFIK
jgi:hypothetical protein